MDSQKIFREALTFETKIRDLYRHAEQHVDDPRGKAIFSALADDEQSHIDFLNHGLVQLETEGAIDPTTPASTLPDPERLGHRIAKMEKKVPERMLGDIKTVLNSALQMEKETSDFYRKAADQTSGTIRTVMEKFLEIENRHTELVRLELDHAQHHGTWFDFMEISLEVE